MWVWGKEYYGLSFHIFGGLLECFYIVSILQSKLTLTLFLGDGISLKQKYQGILLFQLWTISSSPQTARLL